MANNELVTEKRLFLAILVNKDVTQWVMPAPSRALRKENNLSHVATIKLQSLPTGNLKNSRYKIIAEY